MQQRFYASTALSVPGFEIASAAHPVVETGGDYLDVFSLGEGRTCIGVGDVSAHGLGSALVMALTRAYVRAFAQVETDLAAILSRVNRMLVADLEDNRFVTLLLVCLDGPNRCLSYASAGHVPGFQINGSGQMDHVLESSGPPLGLFENASFRSATIPLSPEQLIILLTDGTTEMSASEDAQFGTDGVLEYVCTHQGDAAGQLSEGIFRAARTFAGGTAQQDDATNVVIRVK